MNVAVIGASNKPDRYSYKAVQLLLENGHTVFPVHPRITSIDGLSVFPSIDKITGPVHTVTLYVSADVSSAMADQILAKQPKRIIFNPGAENPELLERAKTAGIEPVNACTLVLLKTGQFS